MEYILQFSMIKSPISVRLNPDELLAQCLCPFSSSEMKKPEDFFSISGISVSKGGTLLKRVGFTAPSEERAVIETQGSKVPPEDLLLSEMEQKSKGLFFISDIGSDFLPF